MSNASYTLIAYGRKVAAALLLTGALTSPSQALSLNESIGVSGSGFGAGPIGTLVNSFTLSEPLGLNWFATYTSFNPLFFFSSFTAQLFDASSTLRATAVDFDPPPPGGLVRNSFSVGSLPAGAYELRISGVVAGSNPNLAEFSGQLMAVAPVPEPEVWAMMLVGAGLIGLRIGRKSRVAAIRNPA